MKFQLFCIVCICVFALVSSAVEEGRLRQKRGFFDKLFGPSAKKCRKVEESGGTYKGGKYNQRCGISGGQGQYGGQYGGQRPQYGGGYNSQSYGGGYPAQSSYGGGFNQQYGGGFNPQRFGNAQGGNGGTNVGQTSGGNFQGGSTGQTVAGNPQVGSAGQGGAGNSQGTFSNQGWDTQYSD